MTEFEICPLKPRSMMRLSPTFHPHSAIPRDRWRERLPLEAICPEQVRAKVQEPLEAPSNTHWDNL